MTYKVNDTVRIVVDDNCGYGKGHIGKITNIEDWCYEVDGHYEYAESELELVKPKPCKGTKGGTDMVMAKTKLPIGAKVIVTNTNDEFYDNIGTITEYANNWDYCVSFQSGHYGYYDDYEVIPRQPQKLQVKLKTLTDTAVIPKYASAGAACFDLCADEDVIVHPGQTIAVSTGLAFEIPMGYKLCIYARSGISRDTPLRIANAPAQIDSDFRGEVKVLLWHTGKPHHMERTWCKSLNGKAETEDTVNCNAYKIFKGDRIAQAEVIPVTQVDFYIVDELSTTERDTGGFGSTGLSKDVPVDVNGDLC